MQRVCSSVFVVLGGSAMRLWPATAAASLRAGPRSGEPVVVRVDEGFHWLDAAIGAAAALGLALLVLGFVLMARVGLGPRAKGER
jgi:hypothetical protein